MLDLLETIAGAVVLAAYLGVAILLPVGVIVLFVRLLGTLLRAIIDVALGRLPEQVRAMPLLVEAGRRLRGLLVWVVGTLVFLALAGMAGTVQGPNLFAAGFAQLIVTLTEIQNIVSIAFTGELLTDMLVELVPATGEDMFVPLRRFQVLVAINLYNTLDPGVTSTTFRWTFAAFASAVAGIYVVFEPLRAVRRRLALMIAPPQQQVLLSESSLERQAELIAQAIARATPAATIAAPAAQPTSTWARPGMARPATAAAPTAPGAVASQRVAVVTWDGELATELERQLDAAGFAPIVMRSVAEAFASRVWPQLVFIDARHLQWLSPDRLPLLVRARLIAVTRDDLRVPAGWQLDTHAIGGGADALLDLLRRRDARRKAGTRETGA